MVRTVQLVMLLIPARPVPEVSLSILTGQDALVSSVGVGIEGGTCNPTTKSPCLLKYCNSVASVVFQNVHPTVSTVSLMMEVVMLSASMVDVCLDIS